VRKFCDETKYISILSRKEAHGCKLSSKEVLETIKEEFLNLVWIGNWNKFNDVLQDARNKYNHRPNSAFDYKNPLEVMAAKISNLPQQVSGH
jgi:hypothetical protein